MPDVSVAKAHLKYVPDAAVASNRASALRLVHQLLALEGVTDRHLTEQLKIGLWKWTEAEGVAPHAKFNTRYFSAGVMAQQGPASINHEHVWTLKKHVTALKEREWTLDELKSHLTQHGISCIVTVQEHGLLSGSKLDGWHRYAQVGVPVFDRATEEWLDLADPQGGRKLAADTTNSRQTAPRLDVMQLITDNSKPDVASHLAQLLRMARFASAVAAPSVKKSGAPSAYFRIHDALIEEPTPAAAFPHWSGKIDFALHEEDLPQVLSRDARIKFPQNNKYAVSIKVTDAKSRALAEDLLFLALGKLRADF